MIVAHSTRIAEALPLAIAAVNLQEAQEKYWAQDEFVVLDRFLAQAVVEEEFVAAAERLKPHLNRNYIPGYKKGGSVSYFLLREQALVFLELYYSPVFIDFISRLVNARVTVCPESDPHACALYYYTEPGDHIGFHYDTSYYKGARYTVLMGLVDRSPSCRLVCQLYKDDPTRAMKELSLATEPGTLVLFNGDKLWHAVTPLGPGEERIVLTLEYVTTQEMSRLNRLYSNLKDAFGYFGLRTFWKSARLVRAVSATSQVGLHRPKRSASYYVNITLSHNGFLPEACPTLVAEHVQKG
jgi:hypothetical protein